MPATAFGLRVIEECSPMHYSNHAYTLVPSVDGTVAHIYATLGASSAPADVTVAATPNGGYFTVKGY